MNQGADYVAKPDSVGPPVPVVDVQGRSTTTATRYPPGDVGELWIKGPNVVKGYWNRPEATAETFTRRVAAHRRRGPHRRGGLRVTSSTGPRTCSSGAARTCTAWRSRPSSTSTRPSPTAAVIGVPHPVLGEEVGAVVVRRARWLTSTEAGAARQRSRERLAGFKVPTQDLVRRRAAAPQPRRQGPQAPAARRAGGPRLATQVGDRRQVLGLGHVGPGHPVEGPLDHARQLGARARAPGWW